MAAASYHAEIGLRIRQARQALGLTQKQFAAGLGIVQGFLSGLETGSKFPSDTLVIALTYTYGINPEWLRDGAGAMFKSQSNEAVPAGGIVPLLEVIPESFANLGAAGGRYITVPNLPDGCFAIICRGDYMAPTVRDGDVVVFAPGAEYKSGDIILVNNRWGEPILRRYRLKGSEVFLAPDNPTFSPFRPDSGTRIIGTVVEVWRKVLL